MKGNGLKVYFLSNLRARDNWIKSKYWAVVVKTLILKIQIDLKVLLINSFKAKIQDKVRTQDKVKTQGTHLLLKSQIK